MSIARATLLASACVALASCSAPYIGVEAYREDDGAIWFRNANPSLFVTDCIAAIEVTEGSTGELVWDASAAGSDCLAKLPFRYGVVETELDPDRLVPAQPLEAGRDYSVFVSITGGAGGGSFRIEPDGKVTNLD